MFFGCRIFKPRSGDGSLLLGMLQGKVKLTPHGVRARSRSRSVSRSPVRRRTPKLSSSPRKSGRGVQNMLIMMKKLQLIDVCACVSDRFSQETSKQRQAQLGRQRYATTISYLQNLLIFPCSIAREHPPSNSFPNQMGEYIIT
jgi:hypothetical protein